jgi:enoyl-CoA hydratase/carnithine racemase
MNSKQKPLVIVTGVSGGIGLGNTAMHAKDDHAALAKFHPLGRTAEIFDVVDAMLYLQNATFVTGEGFFLTHYDFLAKLEDPTSLPPGPTGLQALPDMLARLSRAPVVSIVSIRGRATGVGSELSLASDMRFASREKAILSQWEVGAGLVPGGGPMARLPRLIGRGRALEVWRSQWVQQIA